LGPTVRASERWSVCTLAATQISSSPTLLPQPPALSLNPDGTKSYAEFGRLKTLGITQWPQGITFQVLACRPESRGAVSLQSASIDNAPIVDIGYCTDKAGVDRASLREGIRLTRKIASQPAWAGILEKEVNPGLDIQSNEALDEYMAGSMHSGNALTGTCAMGTDPRAGAVVRGWDGLVELGSCALNQLTLHPRAGVAHRHAGVRRGRPACDRRLGAADDPWRPDWRAHGHGGRARCCNDDAHLARHGRCQGHRARADGIKRGQLSSP